MPIEIHPESIGRSAWAAAVRSLKTYGLGRFVRCAERSISHRPANFGHFCWRAAWAAVLAVALGSSSASAATLFQADFDSDASGFVYVDDSFRGTSQPAFASGSFQSAGGESGGGLSLTLGGVDASTVNHISGGFIRDLTLATDVDSFVLSFRYNLTQQPNYESDELSQVMVSFDGVALAGAGSDFVAQIVGDGNGGSPRTTGWATYSIDLGLVSAGTHTLVIGGYNNKKTFSDESTEVQIDQLLVSGDPQNPCVVDSECDDGNVCTTNVCNSGVCENPPNTASCDDGIACTGSDFCSAGVCGGTDLCSGDASCQAESGLCEMPAASALVGALDFQRFKDVIADLSSSAPPINGSRHWSQPGNAAALDYIENELASYGYTVERHAYSFSGQTRENVYATKIGSTRPDEMLILSAHMDSFNTESSGSVFAPGANDDASGTALVLEAARVFADPSVVTDRSLRFILWNNEETGLNGSSAYVSDRRSLQGVENPPGSGLYPEPTWIGVITHDQLLWDHGLPSQPTQIAGADIDIEFQASSSFASESAALAGLVDQANIDYALSYPSEVTNDMCCTDSVPFQNDVAAVSVRDNRRRAEIGNGSNPTWHKNSDVYSTYSEADFALGFSAVEATVGVASEIVSATTPTACGDDVLDSGEQCDDGNLIGGDCCSAFCTFEAAGSPCRASAGGCDEAEVCDGISDVCPVDGFASASTLCRGAAGVCDVDDFCDGSLPTCPVDGKSSELCRPPGDVCDVAEFCDGVGDLCPTDLVAAPGTLCRSGSGVCDPEESCDGVASSCPADQLLDGVACDDGDACSTQDLCVSGACSGGGPLDCDDEDPCTADSCDGVTGCGHEPIEGCVDPPPGVPTQSSPLGWGLPLLVLIGAGLALIHERPDRTA